MKTRLTALLLVLVMVVGMLPSAAFANEVDLASIAGPFDTAELTVVNEQNSNLAPGVTQDAYTLYNNKDEQVKMWITTADMSVDTVKLFASYKNMDPTNYGMSKLTEQVASFNEKAAAGDAYYQGTVVAGINASYYNMQNGKPTGAFVMNGIDVTTESEGNAYGYFAVMKDGSVKIAGKKSYSSDKGNIQEAIGIYTMLIEDGKICSGLNQVQYYPRQTIGITADGKVILMTADGNQAPKSVGLTVLEQAQVMLDLGCVWAGHLDGGGSCTYASKAEGSNEFSITNSPSDGSERSVSNGFLIVSTMVSDGKFNSASLTVENEYVTPGSVVSISAMGVDKAGGAAAIPENVSWQLADSSFGTVENGVFTSSGKTGAAVIQMTYEGNVVGETVVYVVIPETITFNSPEIVVPFGKSVELAITATYGLKEVSIKPADFSFTLSADIGTIDGMVFQAADAPATTSAVLTAVFVHDESLVASANVTLGRGSEVIYDFENSTDMGVVINETPGTKYNYVWPEVTDHGVYTADSGKVHSGSYAVGATIDYANSLESGYMKTSIYASEARVFENASKVGVWIYIPDEFVGLWARWTLQSVTFDANGDPVFGGSINSNNMDTGVGGTGVVYSFEESGWHYLWADVSAYSAVGWKANSCMIQLYISDRDGSAFNYVATNQSNIPSKYRIYLDDFTVDYSTAVDDREAPVVSNLTYATVGMADAAALSNQTITDNVLTFGANIADFAKSNATGIDASTVKAYIDGVEVDCTYANGKASVTDVTLTNGKHTIKFAACDMLGNYGCKYGYITVNAAESKSTVKLVAHDPEATYIKLGSIYEMDLVATAIEEVQSVTVKIDLDNNSTWQLDHMTVAEGFEATYVVDQAENVATLTITRTGKNTQTGEAALVTMPVRVWTLKTGYKYSNGTKAGQNAMTLKQFRDGKEFWKMSVIAEIDMGILTRVDDTSDTFTGERVFCDTEMWFTATKMDATPGSKEYYATWNGGHIHNAAALTDKEADCTTDGYTGRTFCQVCDSVVEWGTTVSATGHSYAFADGVLKCECGELLNGVHTDGKTYVDGQIIADGWNGDSYYVDGEKLVGVQVIDGKYYNFGEEGVCAFQRPMSDEWWTNEKGEHFYMSAGVPVTGYRFMYPNPVYFHDNGVAFDGEMEINGEICVFEKAVFVESTTADVLLAGLAGPKCFFILYADGTFVLTGEGDTYDFVGIGDTYLPNISWKNRPWGKETDYSRAIKKIIVGKDITSIGGYYFNQCYNIEEITFEEGSVLHTLHDHAFHYAQYVESVELPDSVRVLEYSALGYCTNLVDVKLPKQISSIHTKAFWNHNSDLVLDVVKDTYAEQYAIKQGISYISRVPMPELNYSGACGEDLTWELYDNGVLYINGTGEMPDFHYAKANANAAPWAMHRAEILKVVIGAGVENIGTYAFYQCTALNEVEFAENATLTTINEGAFGYTAALKTITLPASLKTIGKCGFYFSGLETVDFEDGNELTTIGDYAFRNCTSLTNIYLPDAVNTIGEVIFYKCGDQLVISVAKDSDAYKYVMKYNWNMEIRVPKPVVKDSGNCTESMTWALYTDGTLIIDGTGEMPDYHYAKANVNAAPWAKYRPEIRKVVIGAGIQNVGTYAFYQCTVLSEVEFAENATLTDINEGAFGYTAALKTITLPASLKTIGKCGFYFSGLETVAVESGNELTTIGNYAFRNCASLTSVYLPDSVSNIGEVIFYKCGDQLVISVAKNSAAHKYVAKYGWNVELRVPVPVVKYSGNCTQAMTWALYTDGTLYINGTGAMPDYHYAKYNANAAPWAMYRAEITKVVIGAGIQNIGTYAFYQCTVLNEVVFAENAALTAINEGAFGYTAALKTITLPASLKIIGKNGFYFSGLETVDFAQGSKMETFGECAFRNCTSLTSIFIPSSVTNFVSVPFYKCGNQVVMNVAAGSYAHQFAQAKGIQFVTR